jgi:ABC-2 type transport system permease protein
MIGVLLPLIFIVVVSNRLIAKEVDDGSLAFVLTTQVSRDTLIFTRGFFLFISISAMMVILSLTGLVTFQILSMDIDLEVYGQIMFGLYALELSFAGINFLTSSLFNKTSLSVGFGAGISLGMFLLSTISGLTSDLELLRLFTLNQFFQVKTIISAETNSLLNFSILFSVFVCLSLFSFQIFRKKNLPL